MNEPKPEPDTGLEEWCRDYAPTLPARIESVVAEWDLSPGDKARVRDLLLNHVRQSVSST